ncbi:hypothetical protein [Nocardia sp. NPDC049149]|uniref:hypothetical protein n=1 Tax=Nocardia sp. NPDC049149 TaxID=3364315 RepID=UPI0037163F65
MNATVFKRERWRVQHLHCRDESAPGSLDEAHYVLSTHAGHGPACLQYLAAAAYASEGDEW